VKGSRKRRPTGSVGHSATRPPGSSLRRACDCLESLAVQALGHCMSPHAHRSFLPFWKVIHGQCLTHLDVRIGISSHLFRVAVGGSAHAAAVAPPAPRPLAPAPPPAHWRLRPAWRSLRRTGALRRPPPPCLRIRSAASVVRECADRHPQPPASKKDSLTHTATRATHRQRADIDKERSGQQTSQHVTLLTPTAYVIRRRRHQPPP
jgi:hypothetical protein